MKRRKQHGTGTTESSVAEPRTRNHGFSLVEMIAAMAILSVMVLLINRLFVDAQQSMQIGTRAAEVNANARAVLDFMARDIQTAIFDEPFVFDDPDQPFLLLTVKSAPTDASSVAYPTDGHYLGLDRGGGREIGFVAPINTPDGARPRETEIVVYRVRQQRVAQYGGTTERYLPHRYELVRGQFHDNTAANPMRRYNEENWPDSASYSITVNQSQVMIQNVRSVRFNYGMDMSAGVGDPFLDPIPNDPVRSDDDDTPLAFLDIHLELLSPHDARQAADLFSAGGATPSASAVAFVERAVRRYHQRVFFHNAQGYYREHR